MNKKLSNQINESVDLLIDNINNSNKQNLNEGLMGSILYFLGISSGVPKHKKYKIYQKYYDKCVAACNKTYKDEKITYSSNKDFYQDLDSKTNKSDMNQTEKMDEQILKENPEKARCITRCRISFIKGIVNLIKEEGDKVCDKNVNKTACKKWIEDNLPDLEVEVEYLEQAVNKINKIKDMKKVQTLLKKIDKKFTEM
ncbi:MAG: hypothetical protein ACOC1K_01190 [Nanoarchaeota archaeon]